MISTRVVKVEKNITNVESGVTAVKQEVDNVKEVWYTCTGAMNLRNLSRIC